MEDHFANGPKKKSGIPWEVKLDDGSVFIDKSEVIHKWKEDFRGLLTSPKCDRESPEFIENIKQSNAERESQFVFDHNDMLNVDFTYEEVEKIVSKAKAGKAPGIDGLLADMMKNRQSIEILAVLFNRFLTPFQKVWIMIPGSHSTTVV